MRTLYPIRLAERREAMSNILDLCRLETKEGSLVASVYLPYDELSLKDRQRASEALPKYQAERCQIKADQHKDISVKKSG